MLITRKIGGRYSTAIRYNKRAYSRDYQCSIVGQVKYGCGFWRLSKALFQASLQLIQYNTSPFRDILSDKLITLSF